MAMTHKFSFNEFVNKLAKIVEHEARQAANDAAFDAIGDYIVANWRDFRLGLKEMDG